MRFHSSLAIVMVLGAAACSGAPTQVAPVTLTASVPALSLERTGTATIQLALAQGTQSTNVTAAAAWTTSNPQVATVIGGVVTAVGPGTASVSGSHEGRAISVPVTVRRRVYLRGLVLTRDVLPRGSMRVAVLYVNGQRAGENAESGPSRTLYAPFGGTQGVGVSLAPGAHEVALQLDNLAGDYTLEFESPARAVEVRDKDTGELVGTIGVSSRTQTLPANGRVTWNITVGAYTS